LSQVDRILGLEDAGRAASVASTRSLDARTLMRALSAAADTRADVAQPELDGYPTVAEAIMLPAAGGRIKAIIRKRMVSARGCSSAAIANFAGHAGDWSWILRRLSCRLSGPERGGADLPMPFVSRRGC